LRHQSVLCTSCTHIHYYFVFFLQFITSFFFFFFFFQAEDGIRDYKVTEFRRVLFRSSRCSTSTAASAPTRRPSRPRRCACTPSRSEERRVGKECRSRWSPYD